MASPASVVLGVDLLPPPTNATKLPFMPNRILGFPAHQLDRTNAPPANPMKTPPASTETLSTFTSEGFNQRYPVGTQVRFWPGARLGEGILALTRTPAWTLKGVDEDYPLVSVEGYAGGISLTHIEVTA